MYLGGEGAPQKASVCLGQFIRRTAAAPRRYTIIAAGSNLISNEDITAGIRQGYPAALPCRPLWKHVRSTTRVVLAITLVTTRVLAALNENYTRGYVALTLDRCECSCGHNTGSLRMQCGPNTVSLRE